jgi:hypothetical protein
VPIRDVNAERVSDLHPVPSLIDRRLQGSVRQSSVR